MIRYALSPSFRCVFRVFLFADKFCGLVCEQLLGAKGKRFAKKRYAEKAQLKKT